MTDELIANRWYWVSNSLDGADWFPAMHDPSEAGGWTNGDTWQDFGKEIRRWRLIGQPDSSFDVGMDASTAKLIETFGQDAADAIRSRNWPGASPPPPPG